MIPINVRMKGSMGELTTDDSSSITPSSSNSTTTDSSAGRGCVASSASGESAGSHGGGFPWADALHDDSQVVERELR